MSDDETMDDLVSDADIPDRLIVDGRPAMVIEKMTNYHTRALVMHPLGDGPRWLSNRQVADAIRSSSKVVKLVADPDADRPDLRNVAKCLRNLADNLDAGVHGECVRAAVVLRCRGSEPLVFGQGDTNVTQTFMDLHAGAQQLMAMTNPERV